MSVAIEVSITKDEATPAIERVRLGLQPQRLGAIIGRSATNTIREHLFGLNQSRPNALGGNRTNYYASAARATHFTCMGDVVIVSVSWIGMAQRYFGGVIRPGKGISSFSGKPTKFLARPARAEAYGKLPGEFNDLVMLWGRNGPYALARAVSTAISYRKTHTLDMKAAGSSAITRAVGRGTQGGEVMFWLKRIVIQEPDETVLPYPELIDTRIARDVDSYVKRLWERAQAEPMDGGTS